MGTAYSMPFPFTSFYDSFLEPYIPISMLITSTSFYDLLVGTLYSMLVSFMSFYDSFVKLQVLAGVHVNVCRDVCVCDACLN